MKDKSAANSNGVSGMAMDVVIPGYAKKRQRKFLVYGGIGLASLGLIWFSLPDGVRVAGSDIRTATVAQTVFNDNLIVRATAVPRHKVLLDAVESGRVEGVG